MAHPGLGGEGEVQAWWEEHLVQEEQDFQPLEPLHCHYQCIDLSLALLVNLKVDLSYQIAPLSPVSTPGASTTATASTLEDVNGRLRTIEDRIVKMSAVMKELHDMLMKHCKSSFSIKGSMYEAQLKSKLAKLFCHSLTRKPGDSEIQVTLNSSKENHDLFYRIALQVFWAGRHVKSTSLIWPSRLQKAS